MGVSTEGFGLIGSTLYKPWRTKSFAFGVWASCRYPQCKEVARSDAKLNDAKEIRDQAKRLHVLEGGPAVLWFSRVRWEATNTQAPDSRKT